MARGLRPMRVALRVCTVPVLAAAFWACSTPTSGVPGEPCRPQRESQTVDVSHRYHFADGSVFESSSGEEARDCHTCYYNTHCLICSSTANLDCVNANDGGQVLATCTETVTCPP